MGNTFFIEWAVFCGYAVEQSICNWGATPFGDGVAPEGKVCGKLVSRIRHQSQDRLQMEGAFCERRTKRFGGSIASPQTDGAPFGWAGNQSHQALASQASGLG